MVFTQERRETNLAVCGEHVSNEKGILPSSSGSPKQPVHGPGESGSLIILMMMMMMAEVQFSRVRLWPIPDLQDEVGR